MKRSILALLVNLAAFTTTGAAQTPTYPDLTYATVGPAPLMLDIYIPTTGVGPYPVLIWIHGGAWAAGDRASIPDTCVKALAQGIAIASVEYRLTSQAAWFAPEPVTFPAQIHDIKGAVRWLRANAANYGLDPARFASHGGSAGGHLSALLATSGGVSALEGDVGGNLGFSSAVQAAIDYFGPKDLLRLNTDVIQPPGSTVDHDSPNSAESDLIGWNQAGQGLIDIKNNLSNPNAPYPFLVNLLAQANPVTWVDPGDPPMFIAHGTNDTIVSRVQSARLSAALFAAGVQHDFRAIPFAGHGLGGPVDDAAVAFLREQLIGPRHPDVGTPFCSGDGSATACPCGNASVAGANTGCGHSLGAGATLTAMGTASVALDTLVLRGGSMLDSLVVYLQSATQLAGGAAVVFGDGVRCIGSTLRRLGAKRNSYGCSQYPGVRDAPVSVRGGASAGATLYYQLWYRDPIANCTSDDFNMSNALAITWLP